MAYIGRVDTNVGAPGTAGVVVWVAKETIVDSCPVFVPVDAYTYRAKSSISSAFKKDRIKKTITECQLASK
eukprot:2888249-Pleurochrysis_carterae.AAC.7